MSAAAVCRSPAGFGFESILALPAAAAAAQLKPTLVNNEEAKAERPPGQSDIWTSIIQAQKAQQQPKEEPYVHPLTARRTSGLLSQKSLETCTESLGSESGSDDFLSSDDESSDFSSLAVPEKEEVEPQYQEQDADCDQDVDEEVLGARRGKRELVTVNYHCSISRRCRSFPPPLPSISRRDGPCLQMRPHRRDGRLVVEAVSVPSQNYLHAERHNGRLLLSFIDSSSSSPSPFLPRPVEVAEEAAMEEEEAEAEEEDEEEVEVVDRGTVVEVKVSTQPQQSKKVHRSSIVINKFVSCTPAIAGGDKAQEKAVTPAQPSGSPTRRASTATTTAAAAAVAASSVSQGAEGEGRHTSTNDNRLLFTSRRRNREELLHDMRRCSQLKKPLFIWEPFCIATSS